MLTSEEPAWLCPDVKVAGLQSELLQLGEVESTRIFSTVFFFFLNDKNTKLFLSEKYIGTVLSLYFFNVISSYSRNLN